MDVKKFLSVILSLSICICLLQINVLANQPETSMVDFYNQLDKMVLNYDGAVLSTDNIEDIPLNRLIVKTKDNSQLKNYYNAIAIVEGYDGLHILQYSDEFDTTYAYNKLLLDEIEYVEYDYYLEVSVPITSSETTVTGQTHISWNSYAVNVDEAFEYIESQNVECGEITVAVIDSGIHSKHEYFKNSDRIVDSNFYFETTVGIDSEGNKITKKQSSMEDDFFHGTAVSSVIFDNTMSNVKIMPYRITDSIFILYSNLFKAFDFAVSKNVNIINISAGGRIPNDSKTLYDKITSAINKGIMVIVAAGNENNSTNTVFPACHPSVITVSATDENSIPAVFSNFGNTVDIAAPGTNIKVPVPRLTTDNSGDTPLPAYNAYMISKGTSYSAPLITAAAATLKSVHPEYSPADIQRIIKETAYVPDGWNTDYGVGIVNFLNMVKAEVTEVKPTITTQNGKIEITAPEGSDSRIYYTLDGTVPTIDNHIAYKEPFTVSGMNADRITAVCHENGKLIGEPVTFETTIRVDLDTLYFRHTTNPMPKEISLKSEWRSTNPNVASVDIKGNITGISPGTAHVYAYRADGIKMVYKVTVEYALWQEILIYFFFGFLWYI